MRDVAGAMQHRSVEGRIRSIMLLLSAGAVLVTLAELWLQDHFNGPLQLIPWLLCVMALLSLILTIARPNKRALNALRIAMSIVVVGGLVGICIHLKENIDFQSAIHPGAAAGTYLLAALKGAAPLLAPGALIFAALIALAATYGHPLLSDGQASDAKS